MFDRRFFYYFDWINLFTTIALLSIGLLFVFSSTYTQAQPVSIFLKKQIIGTIGGLGIYLLASFINLKTMARWGYFWYFALLILLLYTVIGGWIGMGAKRWISLYFFRIQPSEIAKLLLPFFIAYYMSEQKYISLYQKSHPPLKHFTFPLIILFASSFLILKQPDLGTAILVLGSGLITLWIANMNKKFFIIFGVCLVLGAPVFWKVLKPYQQQRILVLLGQGDNKKERYQMEQSKIAIGSGGFTGKGLLNGTQNKLLFLPEDHTDFIFSVICEELGFWGALLVLFLFSVLFMRLIFILLQVPSAIEKIIGIGLISHILLSVCINIGMVVGILPIVGIPLPLLSYGLSNLWVTCASLGVLNNIAIRRYYYS
jgi:rod shape determining protein RodA